jgi:Mnd1 HTH domain
VHSLLLCLLPPPLEWMQDIEKLGAKKGIVSQSIKEVLQVQSRCLHFKCHAQLAPAMLTNTCIGLLQSLVDDDLVHQEKIGSSNCYWCTQH